MSEGSSISDILFLISNISFILGAILLVATIYLFIQYRIPQVIGDLSGRNARKTIEQIRSHNEKTGNKAFRPSEINKRRGKLTETMKGAGSNEQASSDHPETGLLSENKIRMQAAEETTLLDEATAQLNQTASDIEDIEKRQRNKGDKVQLEMLDEVMLIHTNETI